MSPRSSRLRPDHLCSTTVMFRCSSRRRWPPSLASSGRRVRALGSRSQLWRHRSSSSDSLTLIPPPQMTLYARQLSVMCPLTGSMEAVVAGRLGQRYPVLRDQRVEVLHDRGVVARGVGAVAVAHDHCGVRCARHRSGVRVDRALTDSQRPGRRVEIGVGTSQEVWRRARAPTPYAMPFSAPVSALHNVAQLELPVATAIPATSVPCSQPALPCPHGGFSGADDGRSKPTP